MVLCTCESGSSVIQAPHNKIVKKSDLFCSKCGYLKPHNKKFFKDSKHIFVTMVIYDNNTPLDFICSRCDLLTKYAFDDKYICKYCQLSIINK